MNNQTIFEEFVYIYPKILIPFGIICNLLNIILFSDKKLSKISVSFLIRVTGVNNILNLITLSLWLFNGHIRHNLDDNSVWVCKIVQLNSFMFLGVNSWILVLISMERLIMAKFAKKPKYFRHKNFQIYTCFVIYVYNFFIYIPTLIFYNITEFDQKNKTECEISNQKAFYAIGYLEFSSSIMVPFGFMFFISIFIIISLKKSKNKILHSCELVTIQKHRGLKFSITILVMNFVFLLFYLPKAIGYILQDDATKYLGDHLMASFFSIDFFIYFSTNSLMREEFFRVFCLAYKRFKAKIQLSN